MAEDSTLRKARLKLGMSLTDVATHLGVTRQEVSAWELGRRKPSSHRIEPLRGVLKMSAEEILSVMEES